MQIQNTEGSQAPIKSGQDDSLTAGQAPPTVNIPEKHKSKKLFVILGVIIGIIVILIISFFALNAYIRNEELKPNSHQPTSKIQQPTPTPDPTSNWKTYTNKQYGFSLKYPLKMKFESPTDRTDSFIAGHQTVRGLAGGPNLNIIHWTTYQARSDALLSRVTIPTPTLDNINIDGVDANVSFNRLEGITIGPFQKGDIYYQLNYFDDTQNFTTIPPELDQILSTFKFTSPSAGGPTISPTPINCPTPPTCAPGQNLVHGEPDIANGNYCASYVCLN